MELAENGVDESIELIEKKVIIAPVRNEKQNEEMFTFYKSLILVLVGIVVVGVLTFTIRSFLHSSNSDGDEMLSVVIPISNLTTAKGNYHSQ